jgi:RNA polymerase sigma factor (sigma-70 family)
VFLIERMADFELNPEDFIVSLDCCELLEAEIAKLPKEQNDVMKLLTQANLNYKGIAKALGIAAEGTVKSRIKRARTALRAALKGSGCYERE